VIRRHEWQPRDFLAPHTPSICILCQPNCPRGRKQYRVILFQLQMTRKNQACWHLAFHKMGVLLKLCENRLSVFSSVTVRILAISKVSQYNCSVRLATLHYTGIKDGQTVLHCQLAIYSQFATKIFKNQPLLSPPLPSPYK
jgi:hypothetical protein